MSSDVDRIVSELERQRNAIDRAIAALREVTRPEGNQESATRQQSKKTATPTKKRQLSPEGRQRIIDATKKRWAAKRAEMKQSGGSQTQRKSVRKKSTAAAKKAPTKAT